MDWVCDEGWKGPFSQSIFFAGSIIGCLIFGRASDHFGRFWSFFVTNTLILVTGIATPFCWDIVTFCALRFAMGLNFPTFFNTFYLLSIALASCGLLPNISH